MSATHTYPPSTTTPSGCCSRAAVPEPVLVAETEEILIAAGEDVHLPILSVDVCPTDRAALRVGEVEPAGSVQRHPARLGQLGLGQTTVDRALPGVTGVRLRGDCSRSTTQIWW